jgi:hypothetical protein
MQLEESEEAEEEEKEEEKSKPEDQETAFTEVKNWKIKSGGKASIVKAVQDYCRVLAVNSKFDKPFEIVRYTYAKVKDLISFGNESSFNKKDLTKFDMVIIGCPAGIDDRYSPEPVLEHYPQLAAWVSGGGWLLTTDWALFVTETLFRDEQNVSFMCEGPRAIGGTFDCEIVQPFHPFLHGVVDILRKHKEKDEPVERAGPTFKWWFENQSSMIVIAEEKKPLVHVLVTSQVVKEKYHGSDVVCAYFQYGKGIVVHFASHSHQKGLKAQSKGVFATAVIITNLMDECMRFKHMQERPSIPASS